MSRTGVIGVDEAGRGCWAGPVVAAAVWTPTLAIRKQLRQEGVTDSKELNESERERLYDYIKSHPKIKYAVGLRSAATIDEINILQATLASMADAVDDVSFLTADKLNKLKAIRVDGKDVPKQVEEDAGTDVTVEAIVGGDGSDVTIGAASIMAKVFRDRLMKRIDQFHPGYDLAQNKGYGVPKHKQALQTLGPIKRIHRLSYKPLKKLAQNKNTCPRQTVNYI
jgi:ribonuclease HII